MSKHANYVIITDRHFCGDPVVIKDLGPWDTFLTITNDVEHVVNQLVKSGRLTEGRKLLYYDSEGELDEIVVRNGKFSGFAPFRSSMVKEGK